MSQPIVYEQPLNERVRTLLRLEFLFGRARHHMNGATEWDNRATIDAFLDILTYAGRSDLKTELMKELERLATNLRGLGNITGVDVRRLDAILHELDDLSRQVHAFQGRFGDPLKENDLLYAIMQRYTIVGGTCNFDLPVFRYWLNLPESVRRNDLENWFAALELIDRVTSVILRLIRDAGTFESRRAQDGFFQMPLDTGAANQMVRIALPPDVHAYPEISGGRHRFSIRFLQPTPEQRPTQTREDLDFELSCCAL